VRYNVVVPIAIVLIVTLGSWAFLIQVNDFSQQTKEELPPIDDEQRPSSPMGESPKMEMGEIIQRFLPGLHDLVNASANPEELLEFVVNTTNQLEALLDETDDVSVERLAPMLDFFEGLEVELQGLIDKGLSFQNLFDHITGKMGELMESVFRRSKQG
jgi:hypothetical protein